MKNWKINSWRKYPVKHIPTYDDDKELNSVLNKLKTFINHSMHLSDTQLRTMITKSIRNEKEIENEDKQDAIEYFYALLRKPR